MSDELAILNISAPHGARSGEASIRISLSPRVENYAAVADVVEVLLKDKGTFKSLIHKSGSEVWVAKIVDGIRISGLHHRIAGLLNANVELPRNIRAIPEGAVAAFEGDEADDGGVAADATAALKHIERARAELSAAEDLLRRR